MDGGEFDGEFPALFRRAYATAHRILGSKEDAEDVAIETLARLSVRWGRLEGAPGAWVTRVAANRAIDVWRSRSRRANGDRRLADVQRARAVADESATSELRIDLARGIAALPRRQREAVTMRLVLDMSEADVAAALACSPGTVKQHVSRGVAKLRDQGVGADPDAPGWTWEVVT